MDVYTDKTLNGCNWFITNGSKSAVINIPVVFNLGIRSCNITNILVAMRINTGGHLGGSEKINLTQYISNTVLSLAQGLIVVTLTNNNGWGMTNNTPISGYVVMNFSLF